MALMEVHLGVFLCWTFCLPSLLRVWEDEQSLFPSKDHGWVGLGPPQPQLWTLGPVSSFPAPAGCPGPHHSSAQLHPKPGHALAHWITSLSI